MQEMQQFKNWSVLLIVLLFSLPGAVVADDETKALKKQIATLQKELDLVRRERDLLQKELDQLRSSKGEPSAKRPEGEIIGIVWEIDIFRPDGSVYSTQKFLASEGKIYFDAREIGAYTETGNRVRIDVTKSSVDRANGVYELLRTSNQPPLYHGRFRNKKGENPKIQLRVVKD
jgi:hypothetical protein